MKRKERKKWTGNERSSHPGFLSKAKPQIRSFMQGANLGGDRRNQGKEWKEWWVNAHICLGVFRQTFGMSPQREEFI